MKVRQLICLAFTALVTVMLAGSCTKSENEESLTIYYPQVTNIGPSMSFISDAPSYHGPKPSAFAITGVTLDDKAVETTSFSISEASGAITISNTDGMATGSYAVSISCEADGRTWNFDDIFLVKMLPIAPEKIEPSESLLEIPYADLLTSDKVVSVITTGESVSIKGYSLIQDEGCEYFKISNDGVISVNTAFKGEFLPGNYPLTLKVSTYAGDTTYENFVTVKITSKPLTLEYPSETGKVEADLPFQSGVPSVKGSPDGLSFAIKSVEPATDKISIDKATGVISIAEGNGFEVGSIHAIDVTVTNSYGTEDFASAMTITTVAFIKPIDASTFKYADAESIEGGAFIAAPEAGLIGDELTFTLDEVPSALEGKISINEASGQVSATKGNTIAAGSYSITVKAANTKGSATATLKLTIVENPYYFTYIRYGNNLGLANDGTYANQFRVSTAADFAALQLVPQTNAKAGTAIEWSLERKQNCSGTTIDASTGELRLTTSGFKANALGLIMVTATTGKGTEGETTVTVPVFFSFLQPLANGNLPIDYKPFVFEVNPKNGGRSAAPAIGIDNPSKFLIDYRRSFNYYNFNGPASHVSGVLDKAVSTTFLYSMWYKYFTAIGQTPNYGGKHPVSYYYNTTNLTQAFIYVDAAAEFSIVVNANKWVTDDGYANGAFSGQMTYTTDGVADNDKISSGTQIFPVWIWFDEKF